MKKIILIALSLSLFLANFAQNDVALTNKTLLGHWQTKTGDEKYALTDRGVSLCTVKGLECQGTWTVQGKTITITPRKLLWRKGDPRSLTRKFEVVSLKGNNMTIMDLSDRRTIQLSREDIN